MWAEMERERERVKKKKRERLVRNGTDIVSVFTDRAESRDYNGKKTLDRSNIKKRAFEEWGERDIFKNSV